MTNVTIVDAIMGSGKTTWIIDKMNNDFDLLGFNDESKKAYIYITPFLDEVERIQSACPLLGFVSPMPKSGKKMKHLNELITNRENIGTTHALFSMINKETRETLSESNYTLVIDEETEWVREYEIKNSDIETLFESDMVRVDERKRLRWNNLKWRTYDGRFNEIRALCDNGNLIMAHDKLLIWEFPAEFLSLFSEVYVLTYLFEGSVMSMYLRANEVPYELMSLNSGKLVCYEERDEQDFKDIAKQLITIIDDSSLNAIGSPVGTENPMSATWYRLDKKRGGLKINRLKNAVYNFFRNHAQGKTSENMWSCYKGYLMDLKGKGYTKGWTPCNLRATNDHVERKNLAYLINVFMRPRLVQYFRENGVEPDQDLYALSQLIQWIYRSQIRREDPILLFLPSERMRGLLRSWLNEGSERHLQMAA